MSVSFARGLVAIILFSGTLPAPAAWEDLDAGTRGRAPEIVITATRTPTSVQEIGSTFSRITATDLERLGSTAVLDALSTVPGVDIRRQGGPGTATAIFTRGTDSDHTLVLVDGVKLHDPSSPTGAAVLDHLLALNIQSIEVLRGPQSTLYGSEAIGGVVQVLTARGEGPLSLTLTTQGGSFQTFYHRFLAQAGSDRFNFSISGARIDSAGFSAVATDAEDDPYRNTSAAGRIGWTPSDLFSIDFYFRAIDAESEFDSGTNLDVSETRSRQTVFKVEPHLMLLDGRWEQKLGLSVSEIDRKNGGTGFFFPTQFDGRILAIDWQHDLEISPTNRLVIGLDWESSRGGFATPSAPPFKVDSDVLGLYLQDQLALGKRVNLTIGGRIDDHDQFGTEATYRIAAAARLNAKGTLLRGSFGTGFKAPTLSELFDSSFGANNLALQAETSQGADLGLEQSLGDGRLVVGATGFYNLIDDMIVAIDVDPGPGFLFRNVNIEKAATSGLEAFVQLQAAPSLTARVSYTYTDTEARDAFSFGIGDGSRLLRRPLHKFAADLTHRFWDQRAAATLSAQYVGVRDDLDPVTFATVEAGSYFVVDVRGAVRLSPQTEVFAGVNNLLDEDYQDVLGFNRPGVNAYGGVKVRF